jgi:hypothetical protein
MSRRSVVRGQVPSVIAAPPVLPVAPICRAHFACADGQITGLSSRVSHPQEGRIAIVTDVGRGMRWTLWAARDER